MSVFDLLRTWIAGIFSCPPCQHMTYTCITKRITSATTYFFYILFLHTFFFACWHIFRRKISDEWMNSFQLLPQGKTPVQALAGDCLISWCLHIDAPALWGIKAPILSSVVYPPCSPAEFTKISNNIQDEFWRAITTEAVQWKARGPPQQWCVSRSACMIDGCSLPPHMFGCPWPGQQDLTQRK